MSSSIYIHIPFCLTRCTYCDFNAQRISGEIIKTNLIEKYIQALCQEIKIRAQENKYKNKYIKSIYFGGGTPSVLSSELLALIFETLKIYFKFNKKFTEITLEANPNTLDLKKLFEFKALGINRLSIGVQSFNNKYLKLMGRGHKAEKIYELINNSVQAGFENISLDLIYGLPEQTLQDWQETLNEALSFNNNKTNNIIKHISCYVLSLEKNTFWGNKYSQENLPDEDLTASMYELACSKLKEKIFLHYEISNFALKSHESVHNLNYWQNNNFYGFGVSAHEKINNIRKYHTDSIENYIQNINTNNINNIFFEYENSVENLKNNIKNILTEEIMLNLRTSAGLSLDYLQNKYNLDLFALNSDFIFECKKNNLLDINKQNNNLFLTEKGFFVSNSIISRLKY